LSLIEWFWAVEPDPLDLIAGLLAGPDPPGLICWTWSLACSLDLIRLGAVFARRQHPFAASPVRLVPSESQLDYQYDQW
jgi:hypothetical protein